MSTKFHRLAIEAAKLSPCEKRRVGAVVVSPNEYCYATGFNKAPIGKALDEDKVTGNVVHAEINALKVYKNLYGNTKGCTIYVTHQPCAGCQTAIQDAGIKNIIVVEAFMKFDSAKLRYELIPHSALEGLAKVLTYGARKYKPENWRKGEINRYVGAAYRHFEAWRAGEKNDPESGLSHLEHLLTNVAFLIELDDPK